MAAGAGRPHPPPFCGKLWDAASGLNARREKAAAYSGLFSLMSWLFRRSEPVASAEEHARRLLLREPDLLVVAAVRTDRFAEDVDRLQRHREAVVDVVSDAGVQRAERLEEHRAAPAAAVDAG